jgi:multidrug transporter EmrE-like cation transporter
MGTEFTASASSSVIVLCTRAIIGAIVAVFLILMLNSLLKHSSDFKRILFIILVSVILLTSTILFMTALNNIQGVSINNIYFGVTM